MPDIYLWPGAPAPADILLRDPTTSGGPTVWSGAASVTGVAVVSAVGYIVPGGTVWTGAASVVGVAVASGTGRSTYAASASVIGIAVASGTSPEPYVPPVSGGWSSYPVTTWDLPSIRQALIEDEELMVLL